MNSPDEQPDWRRLLTARERDGMLADIARVSLAAGLPCPGLSSPELGAAFGEPGRMSPAERLGLLQDLLPALEKAAARIGRDPLTALTHTVRAAVPPARARRVAASALLRAVRAGHAERFLEETVPRVSLDTPENRAVLSFWGRLTREAEAIRALAEAEAEAEAAGLAHAYAVRLQRLGRAAWTDGVTGDRAAWTLPPTARASARPDYAVVFRARDRWRSALTFQPDLPRLTLEPRDLWRLYETWCLFQTLDALRALGFRSSTSDAAAPGPFAVREGRLLWTLAQGGAVRLHGPSGRSVSVSYNQTFAEGRGSVSHAMQPDITLSSGRQSWVLDAKFKSYTLPGEEGGDINQMHAYRDGIVEAQGSRIVARAWCLYAGQAEAPNRPRLTYTSDPDPPVGALCLRPLAPDTTAALRRLLSQWLALPVACFGSV